ncbi:MAG: HAMP domain-containing protein [PVC group bacterium]|nr:HAMP domain-containing protein [PVC group bacterium]
MKNKLANKLLIQMIIVVMIISAVFYFIITMQAKESEKRIFDKAKLFSAILGVHMDRIVGDNLLVYQSLQTVVSGLAKADEKIEKIRIIAPESIVLADSNEERIWQTVVSGYRDVIETVIETGQAKSLVKKVLGRELVVRFMPLFSEKEKENLIGVMQLNVKFSSQQAQGMAYLRSNKAAYFKENAARLSKEVSENLQNVLDDVERNFHYLDDLVARMIKDEEIQDIRFFSKDLRLLGSGSSGRRALLYSDNDTEFYERVIKNGSILKRNIAKSGVEVVSPLYVPGDTEKQVGGAVGITLSLKRINELVFSRIKNILIMSLLIICAFCLLIGVFFKRTVIAPLNGLMQMAQRVGKGDFSKKIQVVSNDEIGSLAEAFNQMSDELKKSKEQIEDFNLGLQEKVDKATKELEEKQAQLIESERMASLGVLSSGIAHEINNPLGVILGHAQMLLKELKTRGDLEDAQEAEKLLNTIEEYARRCTHIVRSLLQFAKKREMQFSETDVSSTVSNALMFAEGRLNKKEIKVGKHLASDLPPVLADAIHLEQVFINIIFNAEQSMNQGSKLDVSIELEKGEEIVVAFQDEGEGVSEENIKKIFDPFFSTREPGEGVGLGLSISYGIIKAHGGDINIESEVGKGTRVSVRLPVKKG